MTWSIRVAGVALLGVLATSPAGSYLVRTVTALAAATVLLVGARRSGNGLGLSRRLFAGALLVGAASGVASAGYTIVTGRPSPTGWLSDWLYLSYGPLAVAGAIAMPRTAWRPRSIARALADGAVAAASLWYLVSAYVVEPGDVGAHLSGAGRVAALAYPLVPAFVVAVMLSALPRVTALARPFLVRATCGMALLGLSDVAFTAAATQGGYEPTSWIAAVNQLGLLLLLDAALVGRRTADTAVLARDVERVAPVAASAPWALVPYVPLMVALGAVLVDILAGRGIPPGRMATTVVAGAGLLVRHLAESRESAHLVQRLEQREQAARTLARTDSLTGLANRLAFLESLDEVLHDPGRHPVAVALVDLNDFKDINDTHGHDTGDEVLRRAADRLAAAVSGGGVARLGGDEFAAFVPNAVDGGHGLAATVAAAFDHAVVVGSRPFTVRPSVGVVVDERPPGHSRPGDAAHLLAHADVAMYEAKAGKNVQAAPVAVLTGAARAKAAATIKIREELARPALAQFRVVYQPLVDLATGEIRGAEALLRWRHPEYGEVSPATFIPLAERVGSVAELGDFVFATVLDDLARWHELGCDHVTVGVNVSPRQLTDPHLARTLVSALVERGLRPDQLGVEVTEEALVDDMDVVAGTVAALRASGLHVAVDDFGTGYSSLRYLRRFDADLVKIDREFVQAAPTEPRTNALVGSVVTMADVLGMQCVAEGIETVEQLALARAQGCHFGQGFLLARPMPAEDLERLLIERHVYPVAVEPVEPVEPAGRAPATQGDVVPLVRLRS